MPRRELNIGVILKQVSEVSDGIHHLSCSEIIDLVRDRRQRAKSGPRLLVEQLSPASLGRMLAQALRDERPRYVVLRRLDRNKTWNWLVLADRAAQRYRRSYPLQELGESSPQARQEMGESSLRSGRGRGKSVPSPAKFERNRFTNILAGVDGLDD